MGFMYQAKQKKYKLAPNSNSRKREVDRDEK